MSTDIVPFGDYAVMKMDPDEFTDLVRDNLSGEDLGPNDLTRVRVPAGGATVWQIDTIDGTKNVEKIEGVIVAKRNFRVFYPAAFTGGNEAPSCASQDGITGYGHPEATALDPFPDGPMTTSECAKCPNAEWGTGKDGRGQACSARMALYVLRPDALLPIVLDLPPTSLRNQKQYFLGLTGSGKSFKKVLTRIGLEKTSGGDVPDYSRAVFEYGGDVPEDAQERVNYIAAAFT